MHINDFTRNSFVALYKHSVDKLKKNTTPSSLHSGYILLYTIKLEIISHSWPVKSAID